MSKGFMIFVIVMVLMAGIFHMLFIGFDYVFHNDDSGAFTILDSSVNDTITNETFRSSTENNTNMFRELFGYGRIICIAIIPVAFIINATRKK